MPSTGCGRSAGVTRAGRRGNGCATGAGVRGSPSSMRARHSVWNRVPCADVSDCGPTFPAAWTRGVSNGVRARRSNRLRRCLATQPGECRLEDVTCGLAADEDVQVTVAGELMDEGCGAAQGVCRALYPFHPGRAELRTRERDHRQWLRHPLGRRRVESCARPPAVVASE